MNDNKYKPLGAPDILPCLFVSSPEKAIEFYTKAFGFIQIGIPHIEDGKILHAEMSYLSLKIAVTREGIAGMTGKTPKNSKTECPMVLYLYCHDVESHFQNAKNLGAKILKQLEDTFWGDRMYDVEDLDGYRWTFASKITSE